MTRIVRRKRAEGDLNALTDLYAQPAPDLPDRLIDGIDAASRKLVYNPGLGPELADGADRKWHPRALPFLLFCRSIRGGMRIVDARTDWPPQ